MQDLRSEVSPEQSCSKKQSPRMFAPEGCLPFTPEPTPSHRPCIFSSGATPMGINHTLNPNSPSPPKSGHFYFAENRTFLLCVDSAMKTNLVKAELNGWASLSKPWPE